MGGYFVKRENNITIIGWFLFFGLFLKSLTETVRCSLGDLI